jgi:hypothetical protein
VLVAGSRGEWPRPGDALDRAMTVCGAGLARALGDETTLEQAVQVLRRTHADHLFRRGDADRA